MAPPSARSGSSHRLLLAGVLVLTVGSSALAALRTSATFDETVLVSAGARAVETGSWTLVVDQPPVMPFLYGQAARATGPVYPSEINARWGYDDRWRYARDFYFRVGNDPERLALASRAVGVFFALALVVAAYLYGRWIEGPRTGLLAAFLVGLLPDVVAHGAVAYNDVPLALAFLLSVWALDAAVRKPGPVRGAVAGAVVAVALGIKYSAVALGPVALLLLLLEVGGREKGAASEGRAAVAVSAVAGLLAAYAVTVFLYRGDLRLISFEYGLRFTVDHAGRGHPAPAWLFGETSPGGWWYFFPVAFFVKTPAALHLLLPAALVGLVAGGRRPGRGRWIEKIRGLAAARSRGPVVGLGVFGAFLLASDLNIGFRYALPALPLLLLAVSVGLGRLWSWVGRRRRLGVVLLLLLYGGSTLSVAPWFLSYRSEWFRTREPGREALLDSSFDWGQGLLALRDWMSEEDVGAVRLSYFGSALPGGYGIEYRVLPSFLALVPPESVETSVVEHTVISATNLHGLYLPGDPFAEYRELEPVAVLGGSLYVYREGDG